MYKVLIDTLNHNGRKRQPGELIEMSEADAAPLLKIGAIVASAAVIENQDQLADRDNQDQETDNDAGSAESKSVKKRKQNQS